MKLRPWRNDREIREIAQEIAEGHLSELVRKLGYSSLEEAAEAVLNEKLDLDTLKRDLAARVDSIVEGVRTSLANKVDQIASQAYERAIAELEPLVYREGLPKGFNGKLLHSNSIDISQTYEFNYAPRKSKDDSLIPVTDDTLISKAVRTAKTIRADVLLVGEILQSSTHRHSVGYSKTEIKVHVRRNFEFYQSAEYSFQVQHPEPGKEK